MSTQVRPANIGGDPKGQSYVEATEALIRLLYQQTEPVRWEHFLPVFERWWVSQGWDVEYGSVEDESCAIFCCQADLRDEEESYLHPLTFLTEHREAVSGSAGRDRAADAAQAR